MTKVDVNIEIEDQFYKIKITEIKLYSSSLSFSGKVIDKSKEL